MLKNKVIISTLGLMLASSVAISDPGEYEEYYHKRGPMPFEAMDLNKDGAVSPQEQATVQAKHQATLESKGYHRLRNVKPPSFEEMDLDGNGSISPDELTKYRSQKKRRCGMFLRE